MIRNRSLLLIALLAIIHLATVRCNPFNPGDINITRDYITNEAWDEYNNNIRVEKMKVSDSIDIAKSDIDTLSRGFTHLQVDSTYIFYYNGVIKSKPSIIDTVYFDKYNGWQWSKIAANYENNKFVDTIGRLEEEQWYRICDLRGTGGFQVYLFINHNGKLLSFYQDNQGP